MKKKPKNQLPALVRIRQKAEAHKAKYPTFDLDRFMVWVDGKAETWHRWAAGRPTAMLNKSRKSYESISRLASVDHQ